MSLRLDRKEGYWTVMSVYAPQTGCPEHEKDAFYRRRVERVHGGKRVGLVNPHGKRILDLAIAQDLVVCSTFFAKRESQKVLPAEDVALQHRPLVADLAIPLPSKPRAAVKRKKEAYKLWQKTRAPEHLTAYRKLKRLAKAAVAKAKSAEMDALYEAGRATGSPASSQSG
ncbi:unnamed protein product [Heligmosomoides polygyrus]|uniref:60S ribosomal protein L13a n=1 Tax=Heligmosomoides polygyrus TaxID=6339 RepID=A0A183GKH1_HELPZ|nr:unnamed protein product [Heligmosomoides polygyrus]